MKIGFLSHLDLNLYGFRMPVMRKMVEEGHTVIAICPPGDYGNKLRAAGIQVQIYPLERSSLNPYSSLKSFLSLLNAVSALKLDILHTFMLKPNILGTLAGRLCRVPIIVNSVTGLGSLYLENSKKYRVLRFIAESAYKLTFRMADKVIFQNSTDLFCYKSRNLLPEGKHIIIPGSGIDLNVWRNSEISKIERDSELVRILFVGRLILHKGIKEFLQAAKVVQGSHPKVEFLVAGTCDTGNPSSLTPEDLNDYPGVKFLGFRFDIKELIEDCDIFVNPSYGEGFSRSVLEAAALGKAIIASNVSGIYDILENGVSGMLVPARDSVALAKAMVKLIEDGKLRREYGRNAGLIIPGRFDSDTIATLHYNVYSELAEMQQID